MRSGGRWTCRRALASCAGVGAALAAALVLLAPRPAAACSCSCGVPLLLWPRDGAIDVATDTPIVVELLDCGPGVHAGFALSTADGRNVALTESLRLPPPARACEGETLFLHPEAPLESDATYVFSRMPKAVVGGDSKATFRTGDATSVPEAPVEPDITYLRTTVTFSCTEPYCSGLAEPLVDLGGSPPTPRWVTVRSAGGSNRFTVWPTYPMGSFPGQVAIHAGQVPVALAAGDDCIDVRVYGVAGRSLFHERRCKPDACVILRDLATDDCEDITSTRVDTTRLPLGTCDDPPVLDRVPDAGYVYPDATGADRDSGAEGEADSGDTEVAGRVDGGSEQSVSASGCAISQTRATSDPAAWFAALAIALARRRRVARGVPGMECN